MLSFGLSVSRKGLVIREPCQYYIYVCSYNCKCDKLLSEEEDANLPYLLQCGHVYCASCLTLLKSPVNTITCPNCKVITTRDNVFPKCHSTCVVTWLALLLLHRLISVKTRGRKTLKKQCKEASYFKNAQPKQ